MNPRIVLAVSIGLVMMVGAFVLAKHREDVSIASTKSPGVSTRSFIDVTDSNQNNIPDWQETLDIETVSLGEGTISPMTKTAELAIGLATRSMVTGNNNLGTTMLDLGTALAKGSLDEQYTRSDINLTEDNSPDSLRTYGNAVADIAINNAPPPGTQNELTILNSAFLRNDPNVLEQLDPTITSYEKMLTAMLATPVPSSLVREHLSIINVYQAILNDIRSFRNVFNDALPTITRFRRYQADAEALYLAISNLYLKLDKSGIQWNEQDMASKFIKVE